MMKRSFLLDQATEESAHETPQVSGISARVAALKAAIADPDAVANHAKELDTAKADIARLDDENAKLWAENAQLRADIEAATKEIDGIQAALNLRKDQSPKAALDQKVADTARDTIAALGVPPEGLPKAESKEKSDTLDELAIALAAETDPGKKGELTQRYNKVLNGKN